VRHILKTNRFRLDSAKQVRDAVAAGHYDGKWVIRDGMRAFSASIDKLYCRWIAIEGIYKPNRVPVWIDGTIIEQAVDWIEEHGALVWVKHITVGRMLSETATARLNREVPYFHNEGLDASGRFIDDWRGPAVASISANAEGRNLQHYNTQLVLWPPTKGTVWEQALGRLHRDGQKADTVECHVMFGCREHLDAWDQSRLDAKFVQDTVGQEQKLLYADVLFDRERVQQSGPRWA
jgi:hypothetical protein